MSTRFTVTAERGKSGWWVLEEPSLGAVSQVRHLADAADEMREAIAFLARIPESEVEIRVDPVLPADYVEHRELAEENRRIEAEARARAADESRRAARALRSEGLTLKDIGTVMGVSAQRAAQLLTA